MKKSKGILSLVVTAALIALLAFTTAAGFGKGKTGSAENIKLGLDLAGGVSITYQVKDKNPSEEEMRDTIYKLQKRVEQYSTEANVYQEGDDRINIEIPGVSDANTILDELGKPGSLSFQTQDGETVITGSDVKTASARAGEDDMGNKEYSVELDLNEEGTKKFAEATEANVGKTISIIYDDETISSPTVQTAITGGQAYITGNFSYEEAENLASTIRIGGLKLELTELRSNVVGAQLGEQAISTSLKAGAIGLAIVFLFMICVYLLPGLASSLALIIYTGLVLVILNAFNVTLTLPGIAGIILSIGMAVDANVIIFARVREEMSKGKSVRNSLKTGFQKAMSAIVDGNVTTLIAAAVLWFKGSGSVKGFAQTLAIGIIVSMFTALVITRMIIYAFYAVGLRKEQLYYRPRKERKPIDFLSRKKWFFALSLAVVILGFVFMGVNGSKGKGAFAYSLEFEGGTSTNVTFNKDYTIEEIDKEIVPVVEEVTGDANVQTQKVADTNQVIIKTKTLSLAVREELNKALADNFKVDESLITAENISSTISNEMRQDAIMAVIVATIFMLIYIWFRFKDIRFAASAVTALLHDVLVVLAFYAVARISVGNTFIACMLTIVGYSINATIVIFDRIREELRLKTKATELAEVVNKSITQTLTRSIYTSLTTFVMVAVLYVMGVSSIREFALPLMVGIICGAYSSVCITGALWYVMRTKLGKKTTDTKKK
ncbi:protein translocase subunit SecDF [Lachnospiraceae bacterium]|uniref:protein translocase subunit SecD n=1 Tax=Extibacter sp. GGCC_0201 TaxID=2731209 RepID=UPI001AA145C0|nr:protein translocase subunit SecD [Extibacter sp. GGCC_0201]MBO1720974.1 protein translocase subunit SecD [Extibacter sp. GGCC_0201]BDF33488.1 protein translocase subunit SecDF [Lachnospiraceae bacterium]BDF37492.1 protein translocase subunit SecDF [Lachnospiraceae bacterium]